MHEHEGNKAGRQPVQPGRENDCDYCGAAIATVHIPTADPNRSQWCLKCAMDNFTEEELAETR